MQKSEVIETYRGFTINWKYEQKYFTVEWSSMAFLTLSSARHAIDLVIKRKNTSLDKAK